MIEIPSILSPYSPQNSGINKINAREQPVVNEKSPPDKNKSVPEIAAPKTKTKASPPLIQEQNTASAKSASDTSTSAESTSENEKSQNEKRAIEDLKATDRAVRAHESAHQSAGGGLVRGGASYTYVVAPNGQRYAVGGEVQIDISAVPDNPGATIRKMQQVRRAALAPADPSAQDRSVASAAGAIESKATAQLLQQKSNLSPSKKSKFINAYITQSPQNTLKGIALDVLVGNVSRK